MADTDTNQTSGNSTQPPSDTEFTASSDLGGGTAVEFDAADAPMADEDTLAGGAGSGSGGASGGSSGSSGAGSSGSQSNGGGSQAGAAGSTTQKIKDGAQKLVGQAGEKARGFAEDGKSRAGEALDGLSSMINDAAGNVDQQFGEQYGQYARSAADAVSDFSGRLKNADIDDIVEDVREFVTKSPAVAIGAAAALGFVLVRLIRSGLDNETTA